MLTKKTLVSALIAVGALGAVAAPLPSAAADFGFSFQTNHRSDNFYGRDFHGRRFHQPSRWDRDGDGIPNRYDRTPDGEVRFRRGDRDGDGVPNRFDRFPNDPRWY